MEDNNQKTEEPEDYIPPRSCDFTEEEILERKKKTEENKNTPS